MSAPAAHQFVPALAPRDATGVHTLLVQAALRQAGWRSEIFAEATHDELVGRSLPLSAASEQLAPDDVVIYQFSTSSVVASMLERLPNRLVINFHNNTPADLFGGFDDTGATRSALAQGELAALARRCVLGICDSDFNAQCLRSVGVRDTVVVAPLFDLAPFAAIDPAPIAGQWLFCGRLSPPKAQHELVAALWAHRRSYGGNAHLVLAGPKTSGPYVDALIGYIADLGLTRWVELLGEISDQALAEQFAAATVYVSASHHEGFGIPLVEAMAAGVPVIARHGGGVAGTVGSGALVLADPSALELAAAIERVGSDGHLRDQLVAAGRRRSADFALPLTGAAYVEAMRPLMKAKVPV